ncbi:MAG: glycoside hydrolase family 16 protein, partial [Chitinispirillaceae bacterium]|nr:glycoside hydrolase family 16 protein [Chitinispirillaceae bacterium]
MLKKLEVIIAFILSLTTPIFSNWELIWSDEFEYSGLPDKNKWGYDVGTGTNGWGNNELQYYTKDSLKNAKVENGTLIITARKEKIAQSNYTSARLVTRKKGDWCYGRFEISAKLPKGRGLWPAIWMLPTDGEYGGWPKSGEIDIMENVGFEPNNIYFTIHTEAYNHTKGTQKGSKIALEDPHNTFN